MDFIADEVDGMRLHSILEYHRTLVALRHCCKQVLERLIVFWRKKCVVERLELGIPTQDKKEKLHYGHLRGFQFFENNKSASPSRCLFSLHSGDSESGFRNFIFMKTGVTENGEAWRGMLAIRS
jgi:hypothetical protein